MKVRRIPIEIRIDETQRGTLTLGAGTRLNPETHAIELVATNGLYTTDSDLTAKTRVFNPNSVKKYVGFDVNIANVFDPDLQDYVTGANYRLNDGAQDLYWDGANWVAAGASDWNTEAEVAANISSFPVSSRQIQVVINPYTTDNSATPQIKGIMILMESDLEELEDLVWRSLLPLLRQEIRPVTDLPIKFTAGGTSIDLDDYKLDTPYNIVGIDAVFNYDTDPHGQVDLLDSYNAATKVITLSQNLPANTRVWIKITYEPEVAVTTSQDYDELSKVPAIVFRDINAVDSANIGPKCYVRNKAAGTAVAISMKHMDIDLPMECVTNKQKDLQRMCQELDRFFGKNTLLRSKGLDREYSMRLISEYDGTTNPTQDELYTGRFRARISKALFFDGPEEDVYTVNQFTLRGDVDAVIS